MYATWNSHRCWPPPRSFGMFVLMAPWNMNTANDTEKPVCMRISVMRLFSTLSRPPYTETNGTMSTGTE